MQEAQTAFVTKLIRFRKEHPVFRSPNSSKADQFAAWESRISCGLIRPGRK